MWRRVADVYDTAIPFFSVLGRRLIDALDPEPGERLLDVATGRGACLFPAAERVGADGYVVGVDLSSEMVTATADDLSRRGTSNGSVLTASAQQLGFRAGSFDVVACSQAIGQFPDPLRAALECRHLLRPGGRIGIQRDVGQDERWAFTTEEYVRFIDRLPEPPKPPSSIDIPAVLGDAGFADVETTNETVEFVFPDEQAWWDNAWAAGAGRTRLEPLPEDARAEYRAAVFTRMQPLRTADGFPFELTITRVLARR